ncbi:MAG TPA: glycosyltransferase family 87 protein [Rariglobus sp.]|nr:glycosyltransferase family 87 protein [Rariglobus sp.]
MTSRRSSFIWLALTVGAAALLWFIIWHAYPPYKNGHFDRAESYEARWPRVAPFNLPAVDSPAFYDLQVILWGIEVSAQGRDPYHEPPPEGASYFYNYPSIWLHLSSLGLNLEWTRPLGLALAGSFLISVILITRPRSPLCFIWVCAFLFTPPALDALAYANNDLLVFTLFAVAAFWWATRFPLGGWPAIGLIGIAALLKLYPVCALLAFLDGRRRTLVVTCITGMMLALFFTANLSELQTVSSQTPRPHYRAIGSQVLSSRLLDGATRNPPALAKLESVAKLAVWQRVLPLVTTGTLLVILGVCAWRGFRHAHTMTDNHADAVQRIAFRLGACAHIAIFVIGHNYMHREILLILTGPWLLAEANRRWLAILIMPITWLATVPTGPWFLFVQLSSWVLTAGLAYWLIRDLAPDLEKTGFIKIHSAMSPPTVH